MQNQAATLRLFNEKVTRLQSSRLGQRLSVATPEVVAKFSGARITQSGHYAFDIVGSVQSEMSEHDQDDIDAFLLTY